MDYKKFLENDILPVWTEISSDTINGGVFTCFDGKHTPIGDTKSIMSQGRFLWTLSVAYMHVSPKAEYLDICKSIFHFLRKCTAERGKLPFAVTRDGKPVTVAERTFYAEMYCAMGCAQYYKAVREPDVKKYSELLFDFVYDRYMSQQNSCQDEEPERNTRCFGVHMTALMMTQALRDAKIRCEKAEEITDLAIAQMKDSGFVDDGKKCVYEHAPLPGYELTGSDAVTSCVGHVYEAAWFVMCEGELRDDDGLRLFGKKLLDYAMPKGFEKITEFIPTSIDTTKSVTENTASGEFEVFPQQEAIIAYYLASRLFGEEKYFETAKRLEGSFLSYCEKFEGVFWRGKIYVTDGEYVFPPSATGHIASPFHLERYLLVLDILQKQQHFGIYESERKPQ